VRFQFLIGRLKTNINELNGIKPIYGFQFLIGRLKTLVKKPFYQHEERVSIPHRQAKNAVLSKLPYLVIWFQFLIGRLKTHTL